VAADARRNRVVTDLHWMTATEAARAIAARELSPVELMGGLLERISRLDPRLNVFIRLDGDAAMDAAKAAESEIMSGRQRGPLHGVPVGIKDIIDVAGLPTTCHSKVLIDNVASADAVCVSRLRGAGVIVLGQALHARIRDRRSQFRSSVGARAQPMEYRPPPGRLVFRLRRGLGGGALPYGARERHWRQRPKPRQCLRDRRTQADLRSGLAPWCLPAFVHA
jgi:hypothetical protein